MLALRTSVHIWQNPTTVFVDKLLSKYNFTLLDLDWSNFELLKNDKDHFTWKGYVRFCNALAQALNKKGVEKICIFSDSTIDYWNDPNSYANTYLQKELAKKNITSIVDAVNGSGFVARGIMSSGDFYSRIRRHARRGSIDKNSTIMFIGGWNDAHCEHKLEREIRRISYFVESLHSGEGPRVIQNGNNTQ
jgi:hypothetical protein